MRIFIDSTATWRKPEHGTGIPRVVRELALRCARCAPEGVDAIPVRLARGAWLRADFADSTAARFRAGLRHMLLRLRTTRRHALDRMRRGALHWLIVLAISCPVELLCVIFEGVQRFALDAFAERAALRSGDVLLLADYPKGTQLHAVQSAQRAGVIIVALLYDSIPLTHPHFFSATSLQQFREWLTWALRNADGVMGISQHVVDTLREHSTESGPWMDHFPLGADFRVSAPRPVRREVAALPWQRCLLMVGTLEPRKNHAQALDAMDLVWNAGHDAVLLIIGRAGVHCADVTERIAQHRESGRRLFWIRDLNDTELECCYAQARALIAASHAEGFGLPVLEALARGLEVFAADIPAFREVAGDHARFFPLGDAQALAALITLTLKTSRPAPVPHSWPDWNECTRLLLSRIRERVQNEVRA